MLCERNIDIAFLWSTLYIAFSKCIVSWFWFSFFHFPLFTQNAFVKIIYSWKFRCSTKGAVILLCSWSTLHLVVWKCIVFLFYIFYLFIYLLFAPFHPKYLCKSHFFFKFSVFHKRSSVIASFVEHPAYSKLEMYSALILVLFILFCHVWPKVNV